MLLHWTKCPFTPVTWRSVASACVGRRCSTCAKQFGLEHRTVMNGASAKRKGRARNTTVKGGGKKKIRVAFIHVLPMWMLALVAVTPR